MDKTKVIAAMNQALGMELASALKYLGWSFHVFGPTRKPIVEHFLEEAKESFDHATLLGDKIVALGGKPIVMAAAPKPADGITVGDMLKQAMYISMIRYNVRESVGRYLSELMEADLTFYIEDPSVDF